MVRNILQLKTTRTDIGTHEMKTGNCRKVPANIAPKMNDILIWRLY